MSIFASNLSPHNSLSHIQDMQENGLSILPDQLDVYLPSIAAEHSTQGVLNPFLKITVCATSTHNSIPKTHLCGLKTLVKEGALKTTAAKVAKLIDLQIPTSHEILTTIYEQLENASFFFNRKVAYPVLFQCSFENVGESAPEFFLEVHKTKKVFLLIFNHTSTTISEGRFKSVIKVYDLKNPAIYAYALSIPSGDRYVDNYIHKNEEEFLGLFNGTKQIIKVYALHYYGEYQAILMKYYPQDLFGVIEQISRDPVSIAPQIKINYCQQMLETIQLLHAKHVIHRDIKADNFLVQDKAAKGHRLKVADFGLACYDDDQDSLKLVVGTPSYLAPEGWNKNIPARGKPLDIWAAGCVFWMIWKGAAYPWYDHDPEKPDDQEDLMKELLWFHKTRPSPENHLELLLWHMLDPNPEKRWNVELCLDYLNQYGSSFR